MAAESDKYILRSGAIDAIKRNAGTLYTREAEFLLQKVIFLLKNAPAADVAEVVRCKDCKHRTEAGNCGHPRHHGILPSAYPYDFCSYGERREGGNANVSD